MEPITGGKQSAQNKEAADHVAEAHSLLQDLRNEISQHPKLEDAILRLEAALNLLSTKTGGML
jgi:hypothetical protein